MRVNIVDKIMGGGKTSAAINYINDPANSEKRFLYITPYLNEVQRVIKSCPDRKFKEPKSYGTKLNGIQYLFERGVNIVSTHSLFRLFNSEIIDLVYNNNYILIMDEVADVIQPLQITKYDLETLLEKYTFVDENSILRWVAKDYIGDFQKYKDLCELECIGIYNDTAILWLFPVATFRAFHEIFILTYMFKAQVQKYYFDFYNIEYKWLDIDGNSLETYRFSFDSDGETENYYLDGPKFRKLIQICENDKLNQIGDLDTSLSKSWYERNMNNTLMKTLRDDTYNFFRNHAKTKSNLNLWTTFKDYKDVVTGKGYAKGFLSSNMRATNEYKDRTAIAYLVNKYFNPHIKNFFYSHDIKIDEDGYALSEMLQFIWRSAIRENNPIQIYIPSSRMRNILSKWLNGGETIIT